MKKKNIARKEPALDARLFEPIQPHGGITFAGSSYIRMGDGYSELLHPLQHLGFLRSAYRRGGDLSSPSRGFFTEGGSPKFRK